MSEKIKSYWNERAKEASGELTATTNDIHLRELEIATVIETLKEINLPTEAKILDIGCGDGYSTLRVAREFPQHKFLGVDYSENMINTACGRLNEAEDVQLKNRVNFIVGDATQLGEVCGDKKFDAVSSFRCLINLESFEKQADAIRQIADHLKSKGHYVAIENFVEGNENLNNARRIFDLPEIPVRWHNLYFKENEFVKVAEQHFESITFKDFSSSYYFATRVVYSAMCKMRNEEPDYNHEIHQLAVKLPWTGQFSPIRMVLLRKEVN